MKKEERCSTCRNKKYSTRGDPYNMCPDYAPHADDTPCENWEDIESDGVKLKKLRKKYNIILRKYKALKEKSNVQIDF